MNALIQDVRFSFRSFSRRPGFVVAAVVTLALGIGANTAVFSVFNAVALKTLPYPFSGEIVRILADSPFTLKELEAFQQQSRLFLHVSGFTSESLTFASDGDPEAVRAALVSSVHFDVLGVRPAIGRPFRAEDQQAGAQKVIILSHALWQRRFGGREDILGEKIAVRGAGAEHRVVVGVMPRGFRPLRQEWQAWVPHEIDRARNDYFGTAKLLLVARLAKKADLRAVNDEIAGVVNRLIEEAPERRLEHVRAIPLHDAVAGEVGKFLTTMLGAVGIVLLIAFCNVANLLLARTDARAREMAIRNALGAGPRRISRQLLTESILLGLTGGLTGLATAYLTITLLAAKLPSSIPRSSDIGIDFTVLAFALAVSLLGGVLFGLAPALRLLTADPQTGLRDGEQRITSSRIRLNSLLVVGEIALAVILAAAAGLMLKSLWLLNQVDPGFVAPRLLTLRLAPPEARYATLPERVNYFQKVLDEAQAVPGVVAAEAVYPLPMTAARIVLAYEVEGHPAEPGKPPFYTGYSTVSAGYFRAMGIPMLEGRAFSESDRSGQPEVVIINRAMSRRHWLEGSSLGNRIRWAGSSRWLTIVGVAGDIKQNGLDAETAEMAYRPYPQEAWFSSLYLTVRTSGPPAGAGAALRSAIWSVDREVPIQSVKTMENVIAGTQTDSRFLTLLLVLAGTLALALGAVGVYGVMSVAASGRRREYGIRIALGASRGQILRQALWRGSAPAAAGVALGLLGAAASTRLLSSLLYQVPSTDPYALAGGAVLLGLTALVAAYIPIRRVVSDIEPLAVLRTE